MTDNMHCSGPLPSVTRNIPMYVRAELALKLKPVIEAEAEKNLHLAEGKGCQKSDKVKPIDTKKELAKHAGICFEVLKYNFDTREEVKEWIIKNQLGRRNIPMYVRAELALKLKPEIEKRAKENQSLGGNSSEVGRQNSAQPLKTRDEIAKAAGVSHDTIHKVEKIKEKAEPETIEALRKGDISINKGKRATRGEDRHFTEFCEKYRYTEGTRQSRRKYGSL